MPHDPAKSLHDALTACRSIRTFCAGRTLESYSSDLLLRSAVERQFMIIGEALNRIRQADRPLLDTVADLERIIAFRNILVHDYGAIDDAIVWGVIERHLPILEADAARVLHQFSGDQP